ncbi:MAG: LOG family protein [bacterium]|nr:LOG family protein [bacterium]
MAKDDPAVQHPKRFYHNGGKAEDGDFMDSTDARLVRMMAEYLGPQRLFREQGVTDTIVIWGSARAIPLAKAQAQLEVAERMVHDAGISATQDQIAALTRANQLMRLGRYYDDAVEISRRLTEWSMTKCGGRYLICTGGGPGFMEAGNRGASLVPQGRSVGMGISLPFEPGVNGFVPEKLAMEFHYFMLRKFWMTYVMKAMIAMPGGFGTFDELFELITLRQTGIVTKPVPTLLYGREFWNNAFSIDTLIDWGTISPRDRDLFAYADTPDEAVLFIITALEDIDSNGGHRHDM